MDFSTNYWKQFKTIYNLLISSEHEKNKVSSQIFSCDVCKKRNYMHHLKIPSELKINRYMKIISSIFLYKQEKL